MNELASRCGIYCEDCEYKEKMNCPGCQKANGSVFWGKCSLAACSIKKEILSCSDCDDFPCSLLNKFSFDKVQGDNGLRIENLKKWKTQGFQTWLKEKLN